jgi:hypothetical protein
VSAAEWLSFHLFYHGDRDRVVTEYVRPAVTALWESGGIERFYFIRYALGGPHVRLRVLARPGRAGAVEERLASAAARFLHLWPSPAPLPEEEIRQANRSILANDGGEEDDGVHPDNSFLRFPLRFEVARYGGAGLLAPTLDFFNLSSLQALRFLEAHGGKPAPRRLAATFGLLARQVCGLARGEEEEILTLLEYPAQSWKQLSPLAVRADRTFEERRESFQALFRAEAARPGGSAPASPGIPQAEIAAARLLARETGSAPDPVRRRIASSHLHMTANRLGLRNADEVYLARLLWRTVASLAGGELRERLAPLRTPPPPGPTLSDLVPQEMVQLLAKADRPSDNLPHPGSPPVRTFTGDPSPWSNRC